ncbi:MAG: hypothetical protein HYX47_04255 [Burkholderiales bacterium]|nr:hypothetical protein [Burkholderiales bacterium]
MGSIIKAAGALLVAALAAGPAVAVYRCGNVFQDSPCDGAAPDRRSAPAGQPAATPPPAAAATSAPSPFAPSCSRVGEEAQRVAWKREAGATRERQLAEAPAGAGRAQALEVIEAVYQRRGSAPEIRKSVEAECVAEKQKAADTAQALRALSPIGAAPAAPAPAIVPAAASAEPQGQAAAGSGGSPAYSPCKSLANQKESIEAQQRAGGSAARMQNLSDSRQRVEKSQREGKC